MWGFLLKRFALIVLVAAVVAGLIYIFYDSFNSTTDEINKIENYQTFAQDEVRYILACTNPVARSMINSNPTQYSQFESQLEDKLMAYDTNKPRHKKALSELEDSNNSYISHLASVLLDAYNDLKINLTPFQEQGEESIDEFDRCEVKMTKFEDYKSSNVIYTFQETNSGVHFKLAIGLLCSCKADSTDLANYSK